MAKISKEWVEAYFEYGVDIQNRKVFLFDNVDADSIGHVVKGLYLMEAGVTKAQKESGNIPSIEVFIGSFGGSEYEMYALYDVIRTLNSPVKTTAIGKCMSAAPLLVACGEPGQRWSTPNTFFMVHQSWTTIEDPSKLGEIEIEMKHMRKLEERWLELMVKHTDKDKKHWKRICDKGQDFYFDAETAQEWGLIDHIWDEKEGE